MSTLKNQIQVTRVHCPNCGDLHCERINVLDRDIQRIECCNCDYLLITCTRTHRVIEAYAPGIEARVDCQRQMPSAMTIADRSTRSDMES